MRWLAVIALIPLVGCGDGLTDAERKAKDNADVAFVEALDDRKPPPQPIEPQVIGYPDIEKYGLFGASCAFAPGNSLGAVVIAMDDTAWLKLGGHMVRLASDPGSTKLPFDAWSDYDGKQYSLHIEMNRNTGKQTGDETVDYAGKLTINDPYGQLVYGAEGTVQCGA